MSYLPDAQSIQGGCATQGKALRASNSIDHSRPDLPMDLAWPLSEADWDVLKYDREVPTALLHRLVWTQAGMSAVLPKLDPAVWNAAVR